jgi:hypothetical protein
MPTLSERINALKTNPKTQQAIERAKEAGLKAKAVATDPENQAKVKAAAAKVRAAATSPENKARVRAAATKAKSAATSRRPGGPSAETSSAETSSTETSSTESPTMGSAAPSANGHGSAAPSANGSSAEETRAFPTAGPASPAPTSYPPERPTEP